MNEKNLPDDIASKSLNELTDLADEIIKNLENRNNLENTSEDYANLLKINRLNADQIAALLNHQHCPKAQPTNICWFLPIIYDTAIKHDTFFNLIPFCR